VMFGVGDAGMSVHEVYGLIQIDFVLRLCSDTVGIGVWRIRVISFAAWRWLKFDVA